MNGHVCKIILLGGSGVGKSTLLGRLMGREPTEPQQTIGCDYARYRTTTNDGSPLSLHFWDTAGSERFHSLVQAYFRRADVALLVEVGDDDSMREFWLGKLREANPTHEPFVILVKNKCDSHPPTPPYDVATSALTGSGVEKLWELAIEATRAHHKTEPVFLQPQHNPPTTTRCPC